MKKINNFTGEEDVERWIDRCEFAKAIDCICEIDPLKEAQVIAMFLIGDACDCCKNLSATDKQDPESIKRNLRTTFGLRRTQA